MKTLLQLTGQDGGCALLNMEHIVAILGCSVLYDQAVHKGARILLVGVAKNLIVRQTPEEILSVLESKG